LNLSRFKDDYEAALRKLIDAKQKNEPLVVEEEKPKRAKVVNLMDALRKSVEQSKRPAVTRRTQAAKGRGEKKGPQLVKPARRAHSAA
jgi:DNA end-binding protein Ku